MDLSHFLQDCRVYTAAQSSIELIPAKQAAVYAFYELLSFGTSSLIDSIDEFVTNNGRRVRLNEDDWPFSLNISFRGNPERFKGEGRALCQKLGIDETRALQQMLLFLSFLNEPLYIGKTEDLRTRFRAHHDTGFLYEMKQKQRRSPNEFLMFAFFCPPQYVRLVESILIQVIRPPYCDQTS
jgi:hypothetical protein